MTFTWQALVDRARVYLADDHNETKSWIADDKWLALAKVEYATLFRRWLRQGLVRPTPTDTTFTGFTVTLPATLAIVGVAEDMVSYMRMLQPAQSVGGSYPYWVASGETSQGKSISWAASGTGDDLRVELSPRETQGTYVVRSIPLPSTPSGLTSTVDLPFGTDERLVLGIARRAMLKESGASPLLERLIGEADAEISFAASGRLDSDSPRIRRVRPQFHRRRWPQLYSSQFPMDPNYWIYP